MELNNIFNEEEIDYLENKSIYNYGQLICYLAPLGYNVVIYKCNYKIIKYLQKHILTNINIEIIAQCIEKQIYINKARKKICIIKFQYKNTIIKTYFSGFYADFMNNYNHYSKFYKILFNIKQIIGNSINEITLMFPKIKIQFNITNYTNNEYYIEPILRAKFEKKILNKIIRKNIPLSKLLYISHHPKTISEGYLNLFKIIVIKIIERQKNRMKLEKLDFNINIYKNVINELEDKLNIKLREEQSKAILSISSDILNGKNCLLLGEVGSGKTIVYLGIAYILIQHNLNVGILLPTRLLKQQVESICEKIITSNKLILDTHKLFFQKDIKIDVCVIDEEQKFGVKQKNLSSRYIKVSATPLPRTLNEVDYGLLNCYEINLKKERNIQTSIIPYDFEMIRELINKHNTKALMISPTINFIETIILPEIQDLNPIIIHGKIHPEKQQELLSHFRENKELCIATAVFEIGIDIGDIEVLFIFAHKFGIAQLHQFRGRLARKGMKGFCYLIKNPNINNIQLAKLEMFCNTDSGYLLSKFDKEIRGEGDLHGDEQSGKLYKKEEKKLIKTELDLERALMEGKILNEFL